MRFDVDGRGEWTIHEESPLDLHNVFGDLGITSPFDDRETRTVRTSSFLKNIRGDVSEKIKDSICFITTARYG